jgi:DNA-binding transcriptional LysR family regulator
MRMPSLTLDVLLAVIALSERKTLDSAAKELSLGVSAVHKRVRTAEKYFGRRLFLGTEAGMMLTEEGRTFCPEAVRTVEQALVAEEKTKACIDLNSGRLLVGHSTYLPPRLLTLVLGIRPEEPRKARVEHFPGVTAQLVKRVVEGTLHAAFTDLSVSHPDLLFRPLMEEPVLVCLSKSHPLATKPFLSPHDLEDIPIVAVSREASPTQHGEIADYFDQFGVRLAVVADAFGPPEAITMVEQHVGVCLLEASAAKGETVVAKQLSVRKLTRKSGVYVREDNRHPLLSAFVEMAIRLAQRNDRRAKLSPSEREHHRS